MIYKDLEREIELLEMRLQDLTNEKSKLEHMMEEHPNLVACYDSVKITSSPKQLSYRNIADRIDEIDKLIIELVTIKRDKLEQKHKIDKHLQELEGLEYKVVYKKEVEDKPLYQVADELGYSYDWIRKKYAHTKKAQ